MQDVFQDLIASSNSNIVLPTAGWNVWQNALKWHSKRHTKVYNNKGVIAWKADTMEICTKALENGAQSRREDEEDKIIYELRFVEPSNIETENTDMAEYTSTSPALL